MDELVARAGDGDIEFALVWLAGGPSPNFSCARSVGIGHSRRKVR